MADRKGTPAWDPPPPERRPPPTHPTSRPTTRPSLRRPELTNQEINYDKHWRRALPERTKKEKLSHEEILAAWYRHKEQKEYDDKVATGLKNTVNRLIEMQKAIDTKRKVAKLHTKEE